MRGLILAAKNGDLSKTNTYLQRDGLNVNAVDEDGRSALHYAVKGHLGVAEQLLKHNADPNLIDVYKATPLHRATDGHFKLVELLIESQARVDEENEWGYVPLHEAALKGHERIINILIENKADVNHQNQYGDSPLHFACQRGHIKAIAKLLAHKAFVNLKNNDEELPVDKARNKGHMECVELLEGHLHHPIPFAVPKGRTQSLTDFLGEEEAKQDDDADRKKTSRHKSMPPPAIQEELSDGKDADRDKSVDAADVWSTCRSILELENLTMNEWRDIRAKLKENYTTDQWHTIKHSGTLKDVKKRCKKYLRQQHVHSDPEDNK